MTAPNWFIALSVPARTVDGDAWFPGRVGPVPPGVRRFVPEDLHLTVAFLGPVTPAQAEAAWGLARWGGGPVEASLGRVVPMGNPRRPSALSATVSEGREPLVALLRALTGPLLAAAGAPPERRDPLPHITLARPTRAATEAQRSAAIAWAGGIELGDVRVRLEELALYTWDEERRERMFRVVGRRALRDTR